MTMSELNADIATITYSLTFLLYLLQHRVSFPHLNAIPAGIYSKLTTDTLEQGVKYVQS